MTLGEYHALVFLGKAILGLFLFACLVVVAAVAQHVVDRRRPE